MEGIAEMTTVFIAAEKLMSWKPNGRMLVHEDLVSTIARMHGKHRFVVYFVPRRFGLFFESRSETETAWEYLGDALRGLGFVPEKTVLFDDDCDDAPFVHDLAAQPYAEQPILFSDDAQDAERCDRLGVRRVTELPCVAGFWRKRSLRDTLRAIASAALHI